MSYYEYERDYYNTPLQIDGVWFSSLADYDAFLRMQEREKVQLQKMTIDLKAVIQGMLNDEKIEKIFRNQLS